LEILTGMKAIFDKFFQPASIAVVGATVKAEKTGYAVLQNLSDFEGAVYAVNPKYSEVLGRKSYARLRDLPAVPDLAVLTTPAATLPGLIEDCGRAGIRAALVLSTDAAPAAPKHYRALRDQAVRHGVRLLGPHSFGLQTPALKLNATAVPVLPVPGRLAFITQSGALGAAILDWAVEKRVGFSHFVSVGFQADLSFEHLIDYFGSDSRTACIMIYLEHLYNARHFISAARAFARSKPIVVLKPGMAPWAEPGTIGADAVYDAAFRRTGIIRVQTIQQLFDSAQALATQPLPAGKRLAIVTNAGGPALLAADTLVQRGGALAELSQPSSTGSQPSATTHIPLANPVDLPGNATAADYRAAVHACLFNPGVDAVLTVLTPQAATDALAVAEAVAAEAKGVFGKPVYASWMGQHRVLEARSRLEALRIPWYPFPERAVTVFMHMVRYRENLELLYEMPPDLPIEFPNIDRHAAQQLVGRVREEGRTTLQAEESLRLLALYGIATAARPDDPVGRAATEAMPGNPGYALSLASEKDPVFGPAISLGLGGSAAAIAPNRAIALPPLNLALARHLIDGTPLAPLLPDRAEGELETVLCRFAYLLMDIPGLRRVAIDPFWVAAGVARALRAEIELEPAIPVQRTPYEHLSIQPYPTHWIRTVRLRDGTELLLRPIRPEDEPLEVDLARRASRESLYFRFFGYMPSLDHKAFARFTHIDYDREMAIVAQIEHEGQPQMIGVVRIVGDGWREAAEYAILVDDAWHGKGVGSVLTDYILEIARAQGYQRVHGTFLKTNGGMRRLFERKGFKISMGPDEADLAELELAP
jgi:acetyltransferase